MSLFYDEIFGQPKALRDFTGYYRSHLDSLFGSIPVQQELILTGMGASFHAAWAMSFYLQRLGFRAAAVEAVDLSRYGQPWLTGRDSLLYVSQSGMSAEVELMISQRNGRGQLIAVTNDSQSLLAKDAQYFLPLRVENEQTVATQTYLNSLACLWLLGRYWAGKLIQDDFGVLDRLAEEVQRILDQAAEISRSWLDELSGCRTLIFTGAGPQAATARQAAQTVAEWAKIPVIGISCAALRHGTIEIVELGCGVVLFASAGESLLHSLKLAEELENRGASVLLVQNGWAYRLQDLPRDPSPWDEFLSPMLEIIPVQLYAEALARQRGLEPGFRYLSKVVKDL